MDFILWIVVGLLAGWLASVMMGTNTSQGPVMDIVLGILGAAVGGYLMTLFGQPGVTGFNLYSVIVATLGAALLIWMGRQFRTRNI